MSREVNDLVASVEKARSAVLESVGDLTEAQGAFKPSENEWSITEAMEHLYLAELAGITKVWSALEEVRAGKPWTDELPNSGKTIDQVVAETWKPKEVAPQIATPFMGGPLRSWCSAFRSLKQVLADLVAELDGESLNEIVFSHVLSGPLDARQRLDFLRFHMERHLSQIERIPKKNRLFRRRSKECAKR